MKCTHLQTPRETWHAMPNYSLRFLFAAAFNIIKALLPPKAVAALRFVNAKNLNEYISEDNMLTCWGGTDDYQFKFVPEQIQEPTSEHSTGRNELTIQKDENENTTLTNSNKKVCMA